MIEAKNMDVAIYLRKSRADIDREREAAERGETYDTLASHRNELLSIVKRDEHNLVDIYEEIVSGAFIGERPEMQRLLKDLANYDAVLVMDIDRLGRGDKVDQGRIERAFKASGTIIITPTEIYDLNSDSGEFAVDVRSFIANMEFRQIKKRLAGGKRRAAKAGKDIGQKPPFGYTKGKDKILRINEDEAKIVRLIFQWCVEGLGRVKTADRLNEMGITSPSGKRWSHVTVRKILDNQKYIGHQVYGKVKWTKQEDGSYKTKKLNDPSAFIVSENSHEPIIDMETWEKAQKAIKQRISAPPVPKDKDLSNPFASIIRCKKCGRAVLAHNPSNRPSLYLRCDYRECKQKMIVLTKVEEEVLGQLEVILDQLKANAKLRKKKSGPEQIVDLQKRRIERIEVEIKKVKTRRKRIYESYEDGTYDKETFLERNKELQEELSQLESDLEKATNKLNEESSKKVQSDIIPKIETVLEGYRNASSVTEQNQLLKSIIKEIRYLRERDWTEPYHFELEIELWV